MIDLRQGDCLELMKNIPDKSIDMILCDLPYGTTACKWDTVIPFEPLWEQYKRIIKNDGAIVLFGSQPFTSELVHSNINWFSHNWVWNKNNASNYPLANKQPLKITEDIVVFYRPDNYDLEGFKQLRNVFKNIMIKIGKNKKQIIDDLGQGLDHCFRCESLQWGLPTEKNYNKMKEFYNLDIEDYKKLKEMYEREFKSKEKRYNPQGIVELNKIKKRGSNAKHFGDSGLKTENYQKYTNYPNNILFFPKEKGDKNLHPTQKPVALLEYLIKTYTNEDDIVLDNCMGSGSTGVACVNTNRNFIGIELDENYFNIAKERINNVIRKE